jgi:proteic killer suppression protein
MPRTDRDDDQNKGESELQPTRDATSALHNNDTRRHGPACGLALYRLPIYAIPVIRSIRDRDTRALFSGRCPRRWLAIRRVAERKLAQLHAAATLDFLRASPGNRHEPLNGDRAGQWSIRIDDQWRICFHWADGDAFDVEIVDYH